MKDKNFGLTEEEFRKMQINLREGNEDLFERIFLSQFQNTINIICHKYSASREDAYDVTMDTIIHFRKLLISDKLVFGNLKSLFSQMAGQKYLKKVKKESRTSEIGTHITIEENREEVQNNLRILNEAWEKLSTDCQQILKGFYYQKQKLYEIAEEMGKTPATLRKQKERCLNVLRNNFKRISWQ